MFKEFRDYAEVYKKAKKTINSVQSGYISKLNEAVASSTIDTIILYSKRIEICRLLKGIISESNYWSKSYALLFALTSRKIVKKFVRDYEQALNLKKKIINDVANACDLSRTVDDLLSDCITRMVSIVPDNLKGIEGIEIDSETELMLWDSSVSIYYLPEGLSLKEVNIDGVLFECLDIPYNNKILNDMRAM